MAGHPLLQEKKWIFSVEGSSMRRKQPLDAIRTGAETQVQASKDSSFAQEAVDPQLAEVKEVEKNWYLTSAYWV